MCFGVPQMANPKTVLIIPTLLVVGAVFGCAEGDVVSHAPEDLSPRERSGEVAPQQTTESTAMALDWRAKTFRAAIAERIPELANTSPNEEYCIWLASDARGELIGVASAPGTSNGRVSRGFVERFPGVHARNAAVIGSQRFKADALAPAAVTVNYMQLKMEEPASPSGPYHFTIPQYVTTEDLNELVDKNYRNVLEEGLEPDKMVWFLATGEGDVVDSGVTQRLGSRAFRDLIASRFPAAEIFYSAVTVDVKDQRGRHVAIRYAAAENLR